MSDNRTHLLKLLITARIILSDRRKWTTRTAARNAHDIPTYPTDKDAVCWDILGAVMVAADRLDLKDVIHMANIHLRQILLTMASRSSYYGIGSWNDMPNRTHDEVLAFLDAAIHNLDPSSTIFKKQLNPSSSNGRTPDFESVNGGSSPSEGTTPTLTPMEKHDD